MNPALRDLQIQAGAILAEEGSTPLSFGNDPEALTAAREGVALCDRSHWGLLKLSGEDRSRFLHNQTTNNINALTPGKGCDTVFVTSTGRTLDLATAYATADEILVLTSPNRRASLLAWMDRYLFPMDKVELSDISQEVAIFSLIGPGSEAILSQLGIEEIANHSPASHALVQLAGMPVRRAIGSGLSLPGYTLLVPSAASPQVWSQLTARGAIPMGDRTWEKLRIQQGRPMPERELTADYNPLEAGLWFAISFDKGCYIGQETIARLNTYKGVKQRLWGVHLNQGAAPDTAVTVDGEKVGILTSCTDTPQGAFGLAYIRTKAGGPGLTVQVGEAVGEVVTVPFLSHEYYS